MIALLTIAVVLLGLTMVTQWIFLYQLIKQRGRMLLRQDDLESRLARIDKGTVRAAPTVEAKPRGLKVGTPVENFSLPDLTGKTVSLEDFKGKQVFFVHWNPKCGFCDLIAPDLAKLQADFEKRNVQLLLVSHGDPESNRELAEEHGLSCPILLLEKSQTLDVFRNQGTPAAYLLDEQGKVAEPLAVGAEQVPALAREVTAAIAKKRKKPFGGKRSQKESQIERNGLPAGTPAPAFELPDIHGDTVSLEKYRARRVLLVFTDPNCGPCDQIAPDLVRLHQQYQDNGLALMMIGRGDPEENRRKAEAHGFEFPVVLQKRWEISRKYGIFAAPVAFLIDEDGVIARNVARGTDNILALAQEGLATGKEARNGKTV